MNKGKGNANHHGFMKRSNFSSRVVLFDVNAIICLDKKTGRQIDCYFDIMDSESLNCAPDALIRSPGKSQWFDVREFSNAFRTKVWKAIDDWISENRSYIVESMQYGYNDN